MTDNPLGPEAMAEIAEAARRAIDAIGTPDDPQTTLCVLGAATSATLNQLPFDQRIPEARRWAETLVDATQLGCKMRRN